jgi:hypothetical protein
MRLPLVLIIAVLLASCGGSSRKPGIAGPGDTRIGETVEQVEKAHPKWTLESSEKLADGREARQYRDFHWTLASGYLHEAEHPIFYFRDGKIESWK